MSLKKEDAQADPSSNSKLKEMFLSYANFGRGKNRTDVMDNAKFYKLIKECGLIEGNLTTPGVDIVFQKVVKKQRKLTFDGFITCLELIAAKKGQDVQQVIQQICEDEGPKMTNTTEFADDEWVKKQTNAALYTGIHKFRFDKEGRGRGLEGRRSEDNKYDDLPNLLDRSATIPKGRKCSGVDAGTQSVSGIGNNN